MRAVTYTCDRCGETKPKKDMVVMNYTISKCGEEAVKKTGDLCADCYAIIYAQYKKFIKGDGFAPKQEEEPAKPKAVVPTEQPVPVEEPKAEEKHTEEPKVDEQPAYNVPENPTELKQGAMSIEERLAVVSMAAYGWDSQAIAQVLNRTPRGVTRCLTTWTKNHGEATEENVLRVEGKLWKQDEEKKEEEEPVPLIRQTDDLGTKHKLNGLPTQRTCGPAPTSDRKRNKKTEEKEGAFDGIPDSDKKVDVGAICALANANWTPEDIAEEVHQTIEVVKEVLERMRKR